MKSLRTITHRFVALFRRRHLEAEFEDEIQFHLQMLVDENLKQGMDAQEAHRQARIRLGGMEQIREAQREQRGIPFLESLFQDSRFALRRFRQEPGLAAVIILTMALGIGANTAIFSILQGVLLRPLPYPEPESLVRVFEVSPSYPKFPLSPLNLLDYQREAAELIEIGGYQRDDLEFSGEGPATRLAALRITPNYFRVLGVRPAQGREFEDAETLTDSRVVIISDGLWRRSFDADPEILGRTVQLQGEAWSIVGVMPPGFAHAGGTYRALGHGETVDAWSPVLVDPERVQRGWHYFNSVARLQPGVTRVAAAEGLNRIAAQLEELYPDSNTDWRVRLEPLEGEIVGSRKTLILVLMAAAAFVLLIACANVASLLLARSFARQREVAVREALGAGRGRLVRQTLTESLLLGGIGGAVGLVVAILGLEGLISWMPADFPRLQAIHLDGVVLAFTAGLTILTAVAFGLIPALRAGGADPRDALAAGGRSGPGGPGALKMRNALVVGEICLASALLIAAGLLFRSFLQIQSTDSGFEPQGVLTASMSLPEARYGEDSKRVQLFQELRQRLEALPGVRAAGVGSYLPWTGWDDNSTFGILDDTVERERNPHGRFGSASPGYFETLGVPLVAGRLFNDGDLADRPGVVLVNQALAETYFPDGKALGRRVGLWGDEAEIVGIVGNLKDSPGAAETPPAFFWPHAQRPFNVMSLAVRTERDPLALVSEVRQVIAELDGNLALGDTRTLESVAGAAFSERRFLLSLVSLFSGLAILLAAVGAYGVVAYGVQQRRRELGVRVALGANAGRIVRMVLGQGLSLTVMGLVLGVGLGLVIGRLLDSLLFGVTAWDPATLATASLTALAMGLIAAFLPALRAGRADPLEALRVE